MTDNVSENLVASRAKKVTIIHVDYKNNAAAVYSVMLEMKRVVGLTIQGDLSICCNYC